MTAAGRLGIEALHHSVLDRLVWHGAVWRMNLNLGMTLRRKVMAISRHDASADGVMAFTN